MRTAKVNGIELEYELTGSGEPLLLISPVIADGFVPLVAEKALAGKYQLVRYHKRGWVGSTHTVGPVSVVDHAADAAALLDYLGMARAHVAGHSSGAAVAAQLALDHPELVGTLTLLELSLLSVSAAKPSSSKSGPRSRHTQTAITRARWHSSLASLVAPTGTRVEQLSSAVCLAPSSKP